MLNNEAKKRENYFSKRKGLELEKDVFEALKECAKGTKFENSIRLISGSNFPDIVAHDFYGVEVKSTEKNHWTSTGSSILESTRDLNVEKIYMTFGKLGKPVEFRSKPYEECLSEIAVTHYPRYRIDMNLKKGETIFDKIKISYDELRKMDNPVIPVSEYYKSKLKDGESLWWATGNEENTVPFTIKLFSTLQKEEKEKLKVIMMTLFPCILGDSKTKYNKTSLWLITNKGITSPNIRDEFSSGGKVELQTSEGTYVKISAIFGRIARYKKLIIEPLEETNNDELSENWGIRVDVKNKLFQWCDLCAKIWKDGKEYEVAFSVLSKIFSFYNFAENKIYMVANNTKNFG